MDSLVKTEGAKVLAKVDELLSELTAAEMNFSQVRIKVGALINEVRVNGYWKEKYETFDDYMKELETRFNRKRTQLFAYAGLVRDLLPEVGVDRLSEMGIEKAKLLQQAKKNTGTLPTEDVLVAATNQKVTTKDFRQLLLDEKKIPDTPQDGKHYSFEYFATADQQKTIQDSLVSAFRITEAKGSEEVKCGVVLEALAQEFLGAHPLESANEF